MDMIQKIASLGIVPVIKLNDPEHAVPLCRALTRGGLPVAEITFRTAAAEESIRRVARELPDVLVGAGTVLTTQQADAAMAAGAKFIVTPGFNPEVVGHCVEKGYPIFPGCPTTSDIEQAIRFGLKVVKFFPAEAMGGLNTIKAVSAPYSDMLFMPTGGVNEDNLNTYLSFPKIIACGGSWMAKGDLIENGEFDKIEELTRSAVRKMLGFELAHIGLNCPDADEAAKTAERFSALFGWPYKPGNSSDFAGAYVEAMKAPGRGSHGHIAVKCNSIPRARAYLEGQGFAFDESTLKLKNGKPNAIYLTEEIGGFAVHLLQK
ncbi:MAG: bifunctional 4-hydroxy-2-oxoglutarate aldolase/2-dehydro-3-deoxy-phosphogluconate aldolase [Clostridia bacterium]|nr:bifunctional 4-hydroxy-2-oxoglutarate aldolase/2-dehydro-3-deoxy-phosphogluconate aldolase [Clostridia bacterium]